MSWQNWAAIKKKNPHQLLLEHISKKEKKKTSKNQRDVSPLWSTTSSFCEFFKWQRETPERSRRGAWRRLPSIYTLEGPAIHPQILWSAIIYKKNIIFAFCLKRDSCHVFAYFIFHFGKVGFNVEALCWVQLFIISGWELWYQKYSNTHPLSSPFLFVVVLVAPVQI